MKVGQLSVGDMVTLAETLGTLGAGSFVEVLAAAKDGSGMVNLVLQHGPYQESFYLDADEEI